MPATGIALAAYFLTLIAWYVSCGLVFALVIALRGTSPGLATYLVVAVAILLSGVTLGVLVSRRPPTALIGFLLDATVVLFKTIGLLLVLIIALGVVALPIIWFGEYLVALLLLGVIAYLISMPFGGMYRHGVMRRYLRHKLTPLFASAAVALCTAMVLIVISVMGGFLDMMTAAVRQLSGDITISYPDVTGFPRYEELITQVEAVAGVESATPMVTTLGLLTFGKTTRTVEVVGIDTDSYATTTNYADSIQWTNENAIEAFERMIERVKAEIPATNPARNAAISHHRRLIESIRKDGIVDSTMDFELAEPWLEQYQGDLPGMVVGIEVPPINRRNDEGQYEFEDNAMGERVTLTVAVLDESGEFVEKQPQQFVIVNESKSGLYERDKSRVYVPLHKLQELLQINALPIVDEDGELTGAFTEPKAHQVLVRLAPDLDVDAVRALIQTVAEQHGAALAKDDPRYSAAFSVKTWREGSGGQFLMAVQREKMMMTFLFGLISVVAVVMIGVIFYMIALDKTRDIGIMRAIGASRGGVASIFLGYGLAVGIVGALIGLGVAALIVYNINGIQDALAYLFGFKMWDPKLYFFDRIPSRIDPLEATIIVITAIGASMMGSIIPAVRAASLNPVESLRYE